MMFSNNILTIRSEKDGMEEVKTTVYEEMKDISKEEFIRFVRDVLVDGIVSGGFLKIEDMGRYAERIADMRYDRYSMSHKEDY
jgi:hypothetical protein